MNAKTQEGSKDFVEAMVGTQKILYEVLSDALKKDEGLEDVIKYFAKKGSLLLLKDVKSFLEKEKDFVDMFGDFFSSIKAAVVIGFCLAQCVELPGVKELASRLLAPSSIATIDEKEED